MRFFTKNIILINRLIIVLLVLVTFSILFLTIQFFKQQNSVEIRKLKVLKDLRIEEKKRINIWADAVSQMASISIGETLDPCILDILKSNNNIPAMWLGSNSELKAYRNLNPLELLLQKEIENIEENSPDSVVLLNKKYDEISIIKKDFEKKLNNKSFLEDQINKMKYSIPILIQSAKKDKNGDVLVDNLNNPLTEATVDYVLYTDSYIIKEFNNLSNESKNFIDKLKKLPIIILLITIIIFFIAYLAFYYSKKSQQDKLWAGIAKETAHQIGTPLSSLMGWVEYLKNQNIKHEVILEIEKDTTRLQQIANRFSKIGSSSLLKSTQIIPVLEKTLDYVKKRASMNINFSFSFHQKDKNLTTNLSPELFSWVIENLLKNSIDSLQKSGNIKLELLNTKNSDLIIDVIDDGKGIPNRDFKKVFDPGHTTKKRGWGLGLSLCKRIITEYHSGKIFVLKSIPFKQTIIRIVINK
mgnify:CR=1 FL=1